MKPHKHAELIKAWVEGAEIEWVYATQGDGTKLWAAIPHPVWYESHEYRIKPEPKPDEVHFYQALFDDLDAHRVNVDHANLKLTFRSEGKNMKLIDAEVLK